jgi:Holliday junction DNA helicase RuvA
MITFLEGTLEESYPTHVVVNVHGVGYHILIPLSSYDRMPRSGDQIRILTHLQVREDAHVLYGFYSAEERDLFRLLINHVSGIGPKTALDVLSGISVTLFKSAVVGGDTRTLSQIKGIGKKTAERVLVELKDKVGVAAAWEAGDKQPSGTISREMNDAILALIALGYKQPDAQRAVRTALDARGAAETTSDELLREALKRLA